MLTVGPVYAIVRVLARFSTWFFFERVEVRHPERVPRAGPVLLCINHPNNLIDSLLVASVLTRKVHYLATAALFRSPLMARVLGALGAIPVYRKVDDAGTLGRNVEMFATCEEAFDRGQLIAIYPEGATRAEEHAQRIKTGALPLGGLIAYRYLAGTGRLRRQLRFGALLVTRAQEARRLLAERREILEELDRTRHDYLKT